jgi:DMSO/TMAO reductase YedYZ molybdopterin-dependent catalytic subunit
LRSLGSIIGQYRRRIVRESQTQKRRPVAITVLGILSGLLAGGAMLCTMAALRIAFGWPTPTELIFDRLFPHLTVEFFIGSLVKAGGYTPLKLRGVYGALAGQLVVATIAGVVYAWYISRPKRATSDRHGWRLISIGVLAATAVMFVLLWPNTLTNYAGHPPGAARVMSFLEMVISFGVCGVAIVAFSWLLRGRAKTHTREPSPTLRRFIALGSGAATYVVFAGLLRRLYRTGTFFYDGRQYGGPGVQKITPTRPNDEFYQVSKNLVDPIVARDAWWLDVIGAVEHPRVYSFAEIAAMPAVTQETTLLCISYGIGSGLCSNAVWKGVPLPHILEQVKPNANVAAVLFHAADGYYETFRFDKLNEPTTLLAYEMNGEPLPQRHGFPLRLIVPGLYGEKNPKWLTRLELLDASDPRLRGKLGFYREQGWARQGDEIPIHSRIDAPQVAGDHFAQPFVVGQTYELRGMAFSGDNGISKVEISTDDGDTWDAAEIHDPGTDISWSLWRYEWTPEEPGESQVVVRAFDNDGEQQISDFRDQVPDGATGLHRVRATIHPT